jgi:uncharacterized protein
MSELIARESPWGPLVVADAHVHFFSHKFFEILATQKADLTLDEIHSKLDWTFPPQDPAQLASNWARELDRHGVHRAALIASIPGDHESVVAAAKAHPDRFSAFAMANPKAGNHGAWKPEAFADVRVACLFPAMHQYSIQSDEARAVFEWAEQGSRAVFVHCGVLSVGVREKLGLQSLFDMRFSNPMDLQAVARRHPKVPVIVPHFGAGYFREALMLADMCPNVYLDTSSSNKWIRYQEAHLNLRNVFQRALDVVGPKRLLFGTDSSFFPRGWHHQIFDDQAKALYELGLSHTDARAIFGENLLRILAR